MKTKKITRVLALVAALIAASQLSAQVVFTPVFTQIRLEARADFDYMHNDSFNPLTNTSTISDPHGFHGRYFNFVAGGNLNDKFSYFFRQRIIAQPGHVSLFDNTDFLYLNYQPGKNWMFRLGKDALAVGGFEYDASPIDVLFSTNYWDNFYCFQLGASAVFKSDDGNHMLLAQVANSPYVHYGADTNVNPGSEWRSGLMAYSLFWSGKFGHFRTLYSFNMFERADHGQMNYIALGHKLLYDRWDIYVDIIHHALATDDWGKNFAVVSCLNWHISDDINLFAKGAYEQNHSDVDYQNAADLDCLIATGNSHATYGVGFEYNPSFCKDVRLHGFVANRNNRVENANGDLEAKNNSLVASVGITWHMNIHRMFKERGL